MYANIDDIEVPNYRFTVLYGESGKRKTTTAVSMVLNRGIYISADNSWGVLHKPEHKEIKEKIRDGFLLYKGVGQLENLETEGFDTIILDTGSAMIDQFITLLLHESKWTQGAGYREKLSTKHPDLQGLESTHSKDFMIVRDRWRPVVLKLAREYPCHVVFLAHAAFPTELSKKAPYGDFIRPRLPSATWIMIAELANIVGYISGGKGRSGFEVAVDERSNVYLGKSQVSGIQRTMDLDDFVNVYKETLQ